MVIYIDLIILINTFFDFLLLLTINIALKRYVKIKRIFASSLFGNISLLTLFIPLSPIVLFLFKLILGLIMCLISFGYKNIRYTLYNILYLYMTSIILGGFLYYLKIEFSSFNYLFLIILSPLILYTYLKSLKVLKEIKNYYYEVKIIFANNYSLTTTGFLDTGNKLKDPLTNKPIILINKKLIASKIKIHSPMYVPYNTIKGHDLLECLKPKKIYINNIELTNYLIGLSPNSFKLNGIECLLNYQILEDINV